MKLTSILTLPACIALMACGGGGGGPDFTTAQKHVQNIYMMPEYGITAAMPPGGAASYDGSLAIIPNAAHQSFYAGNASLDVDYTAGSITGTATGFELIDFDGGFNVTATEAVSGEVVLTGGFAGSGGNITVNGDLTDDMLPVSGAMVSQFRGEFADELLGGGDGHLGAEDVEIYLDAARNF